MTRMLSPAFGVLVTLAKTFANVPICATVLSRSEYDERIQLAETSAFNPSRMGPPTKRLARAPELSRVSDGGVVVALPALANAGDPNSSSVRNSDVFGPRGSSVTSIAGALMSIGIMPVVTSTRSQTSTPGISSGVPVPLRFVMSASPTRYVVCVQLLPCAPTRAGDPALMPPVSIRSPMTSATEVRSGKMLALTGSAPSGSTVNEAPSGGRSRDGQAGCSWGSAPVCAPAVAATSVDAANRTDLTILATAETANGVRAFRPAGAPQPG